MPSRMIKTLGPFLLLGVLACPDHGQNRGKHVDIARPEATVAYEGFSWVVEGELAAMPLPGRHRPLSADAVFLNNQGIRTLVSLTEDPPDANELARSSIRQVHIPVTDFTAPTLEQAVEFVAVVSGSVERGEPVGVHCTAGLGRSGTMAAIYLVANGETAEGAIARVRLLRPGSIETEAQAEAVRIAEAHFFATR